MKKTKKQTVERKLTEKIILLLVKCNRSTSKTHVLKKKTEFCRKSSNRCLRWRHRTRCRWKFHCICLCLCQKYHCASFVLFHQKKITPSQISTVIMMCRFYFVWKKYTYSRKFTTKSVVYFTFTQLTGCVRQCGEERLEATGKPFHALVKVGQCLEVTDITQDLILWD